MNSMPKADGKWKKIKMMRGFPTTFKGETYYAPCLWITETNPTKIASAQKDSRVQTRKGVNEELVASLILVSCLLVRARGLITAEMADERLIAFDNEDFELYDSYETKGLFQEDDSEWYPLPEDMQSPELIMGDNKRISMAFRAINRLQEEELADFFG